MLHACLRQSLLHCQKKKASILSPTIRRCWLHSGGRRGDHGTVCRRQWSLVTGHAHVGLLQDQSLPSMFRNTGTRRNTATHRKTGNTGTYRNTETQKPRYDTRHACDAYGLVDRSGGQVESSPSAISSEINQTLSDHGVKPDWAPSIPSMAFFSPTTSAA